MEEKPKFQWYDGMKFTRDEKTGYYLNSTNRVRLHVYVWEKEVGKIPKGYEIHHINRDKADNRIENLRLMTQKEHHQLHAMLLTDEEKERKTRIILDKAMPLAKEWHGSEDGRKWHKEHYEKMKGQLHKKENKICEFCGKPFYNIVQSRFCSNACKSAWRRKEGLDNVERVCPICGKTFITNKYSKKMFCGVGCSGKHLSEINAKKREQGG